MNASSSEGAPLAWVSSAGGPTASTLPACISEMRSQRSASFMKWVETKMVTPSRRASSISSRQNRSRAAGSTPEVGSSRISTSGWCRQAAASCRRWRMPSGRLGRQVIGEAGEVEARQRIGDPRAAASALGSR